MKTILSLDELAEEIGKRRRFAKKDVREILDELVYLFEDLVADSALEENEKSRILVKARGFGHLYMQKIPVRKGNKGNMLPETTRTVFKLSKNIRNANKVEVEMDEDDTLDTLDE